jgi:hypothetical protein
MLKENTIEKMVPFFCRTQRIRAKPFRALLFN